MDFNPCGSGDLHTTRGGRDIVTNKFNSSGGLQWTKVWGGPGDDLGPGLALDATGNVFATGSFSGTVSFDPWGASADQGSPGSEGVFVTRFTAVPLTNGGYLPVIAGR